MRSEERERRLFFIVGSLVWIYLSLSSLRSFDSPWFSRGVQKGFSEVNTARILPQEMFFIYKEAFKPFAAFKTERMTPDFDLIDFYSDDEALALVVDGYMKNMSDREKIAQMVITSVKKTKGSFDKAHSLLLDRKAGGILLLETSVDEIKDYIEDLLSETRGVSSLLPLISIDAEPSLIHKRIRGVAPFPSAGSIESVEVCVNIAREISSLLKKFGISMNLAPVCDFSDNQKIIGDRSFGGDEKRVILLTQAFIETTQEHGIAATAKHFPGHGTPRGDTHKEQVFIDGKMPELSVFKKAIDKGVVSIMVGHIGIKNHSLYDTEGKPATLSRKIVTDLLKKELGFRGIIITDAMNMKAVSSFHQASVEAVRAGCDMVLIPEDETSFIETVLREIEADGELRRQVMDSVAKIVRLKVCLGLFS